MQEAAERVSASKVSDETVDVVAALATDASSYAATLTGNDKDGMALIAEYLNAAVNALLSYRD